MSLALFAKRVRKAGVIGHLRASNLHLRINQLKQQRLDKLAQSAPRFP